MIPASMSDEFQKELDRHFSAYKRAEAAHAKRQTQLEAMKAQEPQKWQQLRAEVVLPALETARDTVLKTGCAAEVFCGEEAGKRKFWAALHASNKIEDTGKLSENPMFKMIVTLGPDVCTYAALRRNISNAKEIRPVEVSLRSFEKRLKSLLAKSLKLMFPVRGFFSGGAVSLFSKPRVEKPVANSDEVGLQGPETV